MFSRVFQRTGSKVSRLANCLRPAMSGLSTMNACASSSRMFSTSAASTKLAKALDKELQYEKANYAQVEERQTFLEESGFDFFEEKSGLLCYLKKVVDGRTIEVQFAARQPPPEQEEQQDDQQEQYEDPNSQFYDENLVDFSVFVYRDGGDKGLIFD